MNKKFEMPPPHELDYYTDAKLYNLCLTAERNAVQADWDAHKAAYGDTADGMLEVELSDEDEEFAHDLLDKVSELREECEFANKLLAQRFGFSHICLLISEHPNLKSYKAAMRAAGYVHPHYFPVK